MISVYGCLRHHSEREEEGLDLSSCTIVRYKVNITVVKYLEMILELVIP